MKELFNPLNFSFQIVTDSQGVTSKWYSDKTVDFEVARGILEEGVKDHPLTQFKTKSHSSICQ